MQKNNEKIFLIVNLSYFGDILLTNSLCQNLKLEYPDSKIIFLVNEPYIDAAKYQKNVDDVIFLNKRKEHKGLFGLIKFVLQCKYRNKIDASFVIYGNPRGIIVSRLLGAKKIISKPPKFIKFLVTNLPSVDKSIIKVQDKNAHLFQGYTGKKEKILPIKYYTNPKENFITQKIIENYENKEFVGLCCVSKFPPKDMPLEYAQEIINKLHKANKTVLLLGNGIIARNYADNLKKQGCTNFVDLTDVTSIYDLANILNICKYLISVDTGTMHLGYAVGCPVICVFFQENMAKNWAPSEDLYNVKIIENPRSAEEIVSHITYDLI